LPLLLQQPVSFSGKRIIMRTFALVAVGILTTASLAGATPLTWDFSTPSGDQGAQHTYFAGGVSIIATAYPVSGRNHLYGKNAGGDEEGLGLTSDPTGDHEISGSNFIQLDLGNLLSGYSNFAFSMNSVTDGERWKVCFSKVAGSFGSLACQTGTTEGTDVIGNTLAGEYLDFKDLSSWDYGGGNVLLHTFSATATTAPEPASLILLGSGLVAIGRGLKRKRG
jgi:PEP-CTERM motif